VHIFDRLWLIDSNGYLDPDPGSGAFLTPGSGIGFFPDPGSRKIGPNFFLKHFKSKIIYNFVKFVATKKGTVRYDNFFHHSLLFLFWEPGSGSGMGKNQDPG
jgi:hypothetical protein